MKKELTILPGNMVDEMDVARLLCLSVRTLQRYRKKGLLKGNTVGRRVYYKYEEMMRLLLKQQRVNRLNLGGMQIGKIQTERCGRDGRCFVGYGIICAQRKAQHL